jgi:hypothetical protein
MAKKANAKVKAITVSANSAAHIANRWILAAAAVAAAIALAGALHAS